MKKLLTLITALILCAAFLAACGGNPPEETEKESGALQTPESGLVSPKEAEDALSGEIVVYAAASLTESMNEIIEVFQTQHPQVKITANYGSSGTLADQIKEETPCDVFVSAAQKQMDQLDASKGTEVNTDGSDYVVEGSRIDLLENQCVLAVPEGNPAKITSFEDLKTAFEQPDFLFAMGGESVPVGAYTQKIFAYLGLEETALADAGKITYGEDVKGVTSALSEGAAQAGVIYASDAYSANLEAVASATEEMTGGKVIYPAALIKTGKNPEAAAAFLEYLQGEEASKIFEGVGFKALN